MLTDKEQEEIRRKLLGLEEEPPADGWKKIAAEIRPPAPPRPMWWLWLTGLLLLLIGTGTYITLHKQSEVQLATTPETNTEQPAPVADVPASGTAKPADAPQVPTTERPTIAYHITGETETEQPAKPAETAKTPAPPTEQTNGTESVNAPVPSNGTLKVKVPVLGAAAPEQKPRTIANQKEQEAIETEPERADIEVNLVPATTGATTEAKATIATAERSTAALAATYLKLRETMLDDSALSAPERVPFILAHDPTVTKESATNPDTLKQDERKEWYVSLAFTPRYSFKAVTPAASDDVYITSLRTNNKLDPERMGYEFGLNVGRQLKPQLYLEAGLSVMQLREDVTYDFTNGKVDTLLQVRLSDGSFKATPVYVTGERQLKSSFMYGSARVGVTYFFWEQARHRFSLTMAGGMNLLVKGRTQTYSNGQLTETIDFPSEDNLLEQTNYNLMIGAGYNARLQGNYELVLMPNLNYFLGSTFNKREPFGIKPYSLGLSIQLRRRFL